MGYANAYARVAQRNVPQNLSGDNNVLRSYRIDGMRHGADELWSLDSCTGFLQSWNHERTSRRPIRNHDLALMVYCLIDRPDLCSMKSGISFSKNT